METIKSITLFALAGFCEIGGGYLVWLWLRENKSLFYGLIGGVVLVLYGIIPTLQPIAFNFGRVYAAYGGVFVVLSLLWGWKIDGKTPDLFDLIGAAICLVGVTIIMYWPRAWRVCHRTLVAHSLMNSDRHSPGSVPARPRLRIGDFLVQQQRIKRCFWIREQKQGKRHEVVVNESLHEAFTAYGRERLSAPQVDGEIARFVSVENPREHRTGGSEGPTLDLIRRCVRQSGGCVHSCSYYSGTPVASGSYTVTEVAS